jgi:hypothetical protein
VSGPRAELRELHHRCGRLACAARGRRARLCGSPCRGHRARGRAARCDRDRHAARDAKDHHAADRGQRDRECVRDPWPRCAQPQPGPPGPDRGRHAPRLRCAWLPRCGHDGGTGNTACVDRGVPSCECDRVARRDLSRAVQARADHAVLARSRPGCAAASAARTVDKAAPRAREEHRRWLAARPGHRYPRGSQALRGCARCVDLCVDGRRVPRRPAASPWRCDRGGVGALGVPRRWVAGSEKRLASLDAAVCAARSQR